MGFKKKVNSALLDLALVMAIKKFSLKNYFSEELSRTNLEKRLYCQWSLVYMEGTYVILL